MESLAVVLVLVLGLGVAMPLIIGFFSYKEKQLKLQREFASQGGEEVRRELAAAKSELADLRARMAVLERLATDDDRRLAGEIERLRAHEPNPPA